MNTSRRHSRVWMIGTTTMAAVAVVAFALLWGAPAKGAEKTDTPAALPSVQMLSDSFSAIADKASPAVVFIEVDKAPKETPAGFYGPGMGQEGPRDFFFRFFGPNGGNQGMQGMPMPNQNPMPVGQGSGFIISPDGYIVTNNHVVDGADRLRVSLADGRTFDAKVIGSDPQTEIALIKVDATGLPALELGDSDAVRVGEWVMAIGSPFGLSHSVTSGIVSARGRGNVGIVDYADFIQTDAAINPGNSGGPLLDLQGRVIGMNTAIVSRTGGSNGVGFAIPVNMVKYIVEQLRDHGNITRGFLGISIQQLTPELAKWFGVSENHGVLVADVAKDSPAEHAGIQRDDVIVEYQGKPIEEIGAFRSHVSTTQPGKDVTLTILRDGKRMEKTVAIGSLPGTEHLADNAGTHEGTPTDLGLSVQGLTDDLAKRLGYEGESGVIVSAVEPGSAAAQAGIKPGALIKEVNRKEVDNPKDFQQALKHGEKDHMALLLMQEGQMSRYVALDIA